MAMKTWDAWHEHVAPFAAGVPDPVMDQAIRDTVIDFCERGFVLRVDLTPIDTIAGALPADAFYAITPPSNRRTVAPMTVLFDDEIVAPASESWLDTHYPRLMPRYTWHHYELWENWRKQKNNRPWVYYMTTDRTQIRLAPIPEVALTGGLVINLSIKPLPTSTDIEDHIYFDWYKQIAEGALARLHGMTEKWADPKKGLVHRATYEQGLIDARGAQERSNVRTDKATGRTRVYYR